MNDLIKKLSNLRCQFNCFDENERDVYSTLSEAIKAISERPEPCEDAVSRQAAIETAENVAYACDEHGSAEGWLAMLINSLQILPSAQLESCEGCKHLGKWENEVEYGYPSPCTRCKRRAEDHYER